MLLDGTIGRQVTEPGVSHPYLSSQAKSHRGKWTGVRDVGHHRPISACSRPVSCEVRQGVLVRGEALALDSAGWLTKQFSPPSRMASQRAFLDPCTLTGE